VRSTVIHLRYSRRAFVPTRPGDSGNRFKAARMISPTLESFRLAASAIWHNASQGISHR